MTTPQTSDDPIGRSISVLIVTYNSGPDLERCLRALSTAAPKSKVTIQAWDNASGDDSVAKLQKAGVSVTPSRQNIGFAAAVNALAKDVDSDFIFLLNPDAAPTAGALDMLVDAAFEHRNRDMFCGRTVFEDGTENTASAWGAITPLSAAMFATGLAGLFKTSPRCNPEGMPDWDRQSDREVDIATGCALLIRTSVWRALGGFDPRYWMYGEEADLQARMVTVGRLRPWFVSDAKCVHDSTSETPLHLPLEQQVFRVASILRARATLMRTASSKAMRVTAAPLLALTALRFKVLSFSGGAKAPLRRRLWQTRKDWIAGYPEPDKASGAASRGQRMVRLIKGVLDPRTYLHGLRILNFYAFAHLAERRQIYLGDAVEMSPNATFANGARISIGSRTVIAARASLMAGGVYGRINIGEDCLIGPGVIITAANYKGDPQGQHRKSGMREADVVLEANVWIGAGSSSCPV